MTIESKKNANLNVETLEKYVQEVSLFTLQDYSEISNIALSELTDLLAVQGEWMRLILIAGESFRITFKVQWSQEEGSPFVATSYNKTADKIELKEASDFFGEFCNQVAGKIKWKLENSGVDVGVTLPLLLKGFDEIYFSNPNGVHTFESRWLLRAPGSRIAISVFFEITDQDIFSQIVLSKENQQKTGEIEFL